MRFFASLKITLLGMVLLAAGAALSYGNPADVSVWVLVVPLGLLALNLCSAIFTNPRINRQMGLLVFHVGLLALVILVAIGRLTHLDAHIELTQDQEFEPGLLMDTKAGPLHAGNIEQVIFRQGPYTVAYAAGMKRGLTFSHVLVPDANGNAQEVVIGDDRPLVLQGYRFYTSFNKGFSVLLTWEPDEGVPVSGTINMPSYPLFDYKQDNVWQAPGGPEVKFWLQLETGMTEKQAWTLDGRNSRGVLVVTSGDLRQELTTGEAVQLPGGRLRYQRLLTWMGYAVFYDPTIRWLFFVAIISVIGLGWHYWVKMGSRLLPSAQELQPQGNLNPERSG